MLTIPEVSKVTGKSINTIYRYVKQGKLKCYNVLCHGKNVVRIEKQELERFLNEVIKLDISNDKTGYNELKQVITHDMSGEEDDDSTKDKEIIAYDNINIEEIINTAIGKAISEKQNMLMRPIEEQALYRLGILENEVKHLQAEKDLLRHENEELKESVKALPGPGDIEKLKLENGLLKEQIKALPGPSELESKDNVILLLRMEQEALQKQIELLPAKPEEIKEILLNNADNLKALQQDNANLKATSELRLEKELELQAQLSKAMKDKEESLKAISQAAEKEKMEIVEAWKKKVDELRRPWWKFW